MAILRTIPEIRFEIYALNKDIENLHRENGAIYQKMVKTNDRDELDAYMTTIRRNRQMISNHLGLIQKYQILIGAKGGSVKRKTKPKTKRVVQKKK